ncbi:hypothetical protein FISHEDRAFT_71980 [Fistulina hepatica ATCC 64428]|uniref:Distal membrane-arm assembly complex protein 1-like domain-containing protein n=1 Tax=Fistulina hepatica ATCC 64428 TaxID=1128425 RepID=A0A0D7AG26_9AGAR|nr:hypothetical protein FISHEDRAFT_71980 [Fistulina hepatica ATCC 64428]
MSQNESTAVKTPVDQKPEFEDCLPCRIVGCGTLGAVGLWAAYEARLPRYTRGHKLFLGGIAIGAITSAIIRWKPENFVRRRCTSTLPSSSSDDT